MILAFSIGSLFLVARPVRSRHRRDPHQPGQPARGRAPPRRWPTTPSIVRSRVSPDSDTLSVLESLQTPDGSRPSIFLRSAGGRRRPRHRLDRPRPAVRTERPSRLGCGPRCSTASRRRCASSTRTATRASPSARPIADLDGAYFEIVSLESIDDTLTSISFTLFGASVATVLAGAAFGWYSSRRILRPLGEVGNAARALAGGALDTRIRTLVDPDLEPIITSFNGMADTLATRIEKDAQFASDVSPRAALAADDAAGLDRGAREQPGRSQRAGPVGARPACPRTSTGSASWSRTCSRSPGSTPGSCTSTSRRCCSPSSCATPSATPASPSPCSSTPSVDRRPRVRRRRHRARQASHRPRGRQPAGQRHQVRRRARPG